jgi:hypothetical protein
VDSKHPGPGYLCEYCQRRFKTENSRWVHVSITHREEHKAAKAAKQYNLN